MVMTRDYIKLLKDGSVMATYQSPLQRVLNGCLSLPPHLLNCPRWGPGEISQVRPHKGSNAKSHSTRMIDLTHYQGK